MRNLLAAVMMLALVGCLAPNPVDEVDKHVSALDTTYHDFASTNDRICLHSTLSDTKGWHHWMCHQDRVPIEVTEDVILYVDEGDDTVVERWVGTGSSGCGCSCATETIYGPAKDFRADAPAGFYVQIWDNGVAGASCNESGKDRIYGAALPTIFVSGDGDDSFLGGPYYDAFFVANGKEACLGTNLVFDVGGQSDFDTEGGVDYVNEMCDPLSIVDCGAGNDFHNLTTCVNHTSCGALATIPKPSCPTSSTVFPAI